MSAHARRFLKTLFDEAVSAAQPSQCLSHFLPAPPESGRLIVIAAGKAGASMARAAEEHYESLLRNELMGVVVTRHGYKAQLSRLPVIEAGHPVPDNQSLVAADAAIEAAKLATENDLTLVLISGGASSLLVKPAGHISLEEKRTLTRDLLHSGATIHEMNCVRKHISGIKGGRLARYASKGRTLTLVISDSPGDSLETIASGPTHPDTSTLRDASAILDKYGISTPPSVGDVLNDPRNETLKPGDQAFVRNRYELVATPADALNAAERYAKKMGYEVELLGDALEGEARDVAATHAALALRYLSEGRRVLILSGGELTVTVKGRGRGGPNQEYILALAIALSGRPGIAALAADTDGTDGGTGASSDPAGAVTDRDTMVRAAQLNISPAAFLESNDSTTFFRLTDDLLLTGPTGTNVNDFRAILVDSGMAQAM